MNTSRQRRVVITGIGLVTSLAIGRDAGWQQLIAGESGAKKIDRFDTTGFGVDFACQLPDSSAAVDLLGTRFCRTNDLFIQYALLAADEAWREADFGELSDDDKRRIGVYFGLGLGGLGTFEQNHALLLEKGPRRVSPYLIPSVLPNLAPGQVALQLGLRGPNMAIATACASGAHAVGEGFRTIARGDADVMLCGGTEAPITPVVVAGFSAMKALSRRNNEPERASRPFDAGRDGFVIGEGAAVLVLEELAHAQRREATIQAEVVGYGNTNDAYHISSPHPEGRGAAACIQAALDDAGWSPGQVQHINAHGTSTRLNDAIESAAIKCVLGSHARQVSVTANKSMIGHTMGAGAIEAAITVLTIARGVIPPTINYSEPDPQCDLDYVPNAPRAAHIDNALCNSFGFGGANACLALTRWTGS